MAAILAGLPAMAQGHPETGAFVLRLHPYFRGLVCLKAVVAGQERSFLLDTGAGLTVITPDMARRMGKKPGGFVTGVRMDGRQLQVPWVADFEACVDGLALRCPQVGVVDLAKLLPRGLPPLDGVIALDAFKGKVLTLDFPEGRLILQAPGREQESIRSHGLDLRTATGLSGAEVTVLARVRQGDAQAWFLLDSGNADGNMVSNQLVKSGVLRMSGKAALLVSVGGRPVAPLAVSKAHLIHDGVLGADFLMSGPVTLDLRHLR